VLRTRLKTAGVALPAILALILFAPGWLFNAVTVLLAFWGLFEISEMAGGAAWNWPLVSLAGGVPAVLTILHGRALCSEWIPCVIVFSLMMLLVAQVAAGDIEDAPNGPLLVLMGSAWVGVFFPYFALLRNHPEGVQLVILLVLLVVASDSGAYFGGRLAGRIKLAPRVSPRKTVEGAFAGLAASVAATVIIRKALVPQMPLSSLMLLAVTVAILSQLGDLANSAFKRVAGVKDSGWIFPGHGGLLDRACSLVFPAVLTYYYLLLMRLGRS
jgi:phosphatidate cytidylyltransferase